MATPQIIEQLRRMTAEPEGASDYTDVELDNALDASGQDLNVAAAVIWRQKAAGYVEETDITEAGSSRKNSVLYDRAQSQADFYAELGNEDNGDTSKQYSTTRAIVRPS